MHIITVPRKLKKLLQRYNELQDIIAILGMDELSEEDKLVVHRQEEYKDSFLSLSMLPNNSQV